ncbi:MarR family transcriptional regulator [Arthrobacter sp. CAU 1506]|uniref:MarR family winged helix-turn-helix transcriptional regulator n=1 Tax=Arthrobacter sp. CAU 1506 TaxID=2560052 RepID=UPI00145DED4C|nr:MarR family transcriptional regulator [Arthrobacter sp. CAU 1506]
MAVESETAQELVSSVFTLQRALRAATHHMADPSGPGFALQGVMRIIGEAGELRATELAAKLGIGPAALSRHIADLEAAGFVLRRPHPDDGRASLISLSGAGEAGMRAEAIRRAALMQGMLGDWTEEEAQSAIVSVGRLAEALHNSILSTKPGTHRYEPAGV